MNKVILSVLDDISYDNLVCSIENAVDRLCVNLEQGSVIIKPNLCYYWDYSTGQTTDPRVVSAIIDVVRERAGDDVAIYVGESDASAMKTRYSFKMLGYTKLAREKNIELINLSDGEIIDKEVIVNGKKISLPVSKTLVDSDFIINVPTLKTHREIGFSCALKNMFGVIAKPRKFSYHNRLPQVIVAINKIIPSDLVIVDGVIVSGKTPKKMGVIIGGDNAYSTDLIAAKIVGYNSNSIYYLKLAKKENLSNGKVVDLLDINNKLEDLIKEFPKMNYTLDSILWKLELKALKLYAKIVGDIIPPVLEGV